MKVKAIWVVMAVGLAAFVLPACQTTPTQQGALLGGAVGAGAGAIIGNQSHGRGGEGALIGAGAGALTGALIGDAVGQHRAKEAQKAGTQAAPAAPAQTAPAPTTSPETVQKGHYETRVVTTQSGETYEERVWVLDK